MYNMEKKFFFARFLNFCLLFQPAIFFFSHISGSEEKKLYSFLSKFRYFEEKCECDHLLPTPANLSPR